MSSCSGARPTWSNPAVALVRLSIAEIALPIGCRSAASPDTSSCSVVTSVARALPREVIVCSTAFRLLITWSMTRSGRQRRRQRADRGDQRGDVRALALEDLDDLAGQLVDIAGRQRLEQRLEPVEQLGQVKRRGGARQRDRAAGRESVRRARALAQLDVPLPDQVEVPDRRGDRGRQGPVLPAPRTRPAPGCGRRR